MMNSVDGLCGDFQGVTSSSTKQCAYSKPELRMASWMVPSNSSSVPTHLMSELKKETEICSKAMVQPTKVAKAYKAATGRCTLLKHLTMDRPGKKCFSKTPVTQCGPSCKPQASKLTVKPVDFTCLPLGRQAEHYMSKVNKGVQMPELANLDTSFTTEMAQPAHCIHALVPSFESGSDCPPWSFSSIYCKTKKMSSEHPHNVVTPKSVSSESGSDCPPWSFSSIYCKTKKISSEYPHHDVTPESVPSESEDCPPWSFSSIYCKTKKISSEYPHNIPHVTSPLKMVTPFRLLKVSPPNGR